jgi:PPP family 3-phenylpropionic acid transporter
MWLGFGLTLAGATRSDGGQRIASAPPETTPRGFEGPALALILVAAGLHWMTTVPLRGFFAIMARDRGLDETAVGLLFVVGVAAEIAAFRLYPGLRARVSLRQLLIAALASTVLRLAGTAVAGSALFLGALQLLHALGFGLFWSASLEWLSRCTPPRLRHTGQSLFSAATFGLGGVVGTLGTGALYDRYREVGPALGAGALIELVPLLALLVLGRRLEPAARIDPERPRAPGVSKCPMDDRGDAGNMSRGSRSVS